MRSHIGSAALAEVAIAASVFTPIDAGVRAVNHRAAAEITGCRMCVYHGRPPQTLSAPPSAAARQAVPV